MLNEPKIGDKFWVYEHGSFVECTLSDTGKKFRCPVYCGRDSEGVEHGWYLGPLPETKEECDKHWVQLTD